MLKAIDSLIDGITMYRLLLYYLIGLLLAAIGLSFFGYLHYKPLYIILATLILVVACWLTNKVLAYIFDAPSNSESSIITALILALVITPNPTGFGIIFLLAAAGLAMASKYLLTFRKQHLFNPAAIAVVLTAFGPRQSANWWIGTAIMLPFVLIGGVLITRKIRRQRMVITFLISTAAATVLFSVLSKANVMTSLHNMILTSPVFFLGFVMLTEPLTSPPTPKKQAWYGAVVGALLPPQVHLFNFYSSPELALIIGNVLAYIIGPKVKLFPIFQQKKKIATNSAEFVFNPGRKFNYQPGQFMEWTLPHTKADSRGTRRYFTLASSPTEANLTIGVKFYEPGSSFKEALLDIDEDSKIVASHVAGDFILPKDPAQKIVFIAGGIGITPFRSMTKYLIDRNETRSITLLYSARTAADIAYRDVFEEARQRIGFKTLYMLTNTQARRDEPNTLSGSITKDVIKTYVPDYAERIFYISGTHPMVLAIQDILTYLGVSHHHIKIDFFPGYT